MTCWIFFGVVGQAFFFNYFSLGLDLLFAPSSAAAGIVLAKIICHSNTPGHALFGRYKRLPWRLATPSDTWSGPGDPSTTPSVPPSTVGRSDALTPLTDLLSQAEQRTLSILTANRTDDGELDPSSETEHGSTGTSDTAETMILDRASDTYEFKGRLKLEVGSELRALRLPAIVPLPHSDPAATSSKQSAHEAEQLDGRDEHEDESEIQNQKADEDSGILGMGHGVEQDNDEDGEALSAGLFDLLPESNPPDPTVTKSKEPPSADHEERTVPSQDSKATTSRTMTPRKV